MSQYGSLIKDCDSDIKAGRPFDAAKRLARINAKRVPREWCLPLAKVCRRSGLFTLGLRILVKTVADGTPQELSEYAMLLLRNGAVNEALQRLSLIDSQQAPEVLLYKGYAHFAKWEYHAAAFELEKYLLSELTPSAVLLAKTNLAFAYVECRQYQKALFLLEDNVRMAKEQSHLHLECFNYAVRSQLHLQENRVSEAKQEIALARGQVSGSQTNDQFFITKMELIAQSLESKSVKPLQKLKLLAVEKRDWSALRDAELFSLKIEFDLNRFLHLYFGSPLLEFRERLHTEFNLVPQRDTYVLGAKNSPRFDLAKGRIGDQEIEGAGGKSHQTLEILFRDFYEPLRVAGLHAALFPNEYFSVLSSPDRVRQIVHRTRDWLNELKIPVELHENLGFYSVVMTGPISFRVPLNRQPIDPFEIRMTKAREILRNENLFSAKDIGQILGLSVTGTHRFLAEAIQDGLIVRLGPEKRPIGYKLVSSQSKVA